MAGIITLPRAPQTGLSRLGDVIYASAAEYAGTRRADDREARLRAQRLADVESDRGYQRAEGDRQYGRGRTDRLADVESERQNRLTDEQTRIRLQMLNSLVPRYLSPEQLRDPEAVAAAFERAKRDGIIASDPLVQAARAAGVLTEADLGTPEGLSAKLALFSGRLLAETEAKEQTRKNAQASADALGLRDMSIEEEQRRLIQEIQTAQNELESPPELNAVEVTNAATRLAASTAKTPGKPTSAEIAVQIENAAQAIQTRKLQNASLRYKAAHEQLAALRNMSAGVSSRLNVAGARGAFPSKFENPVATPAEAEAPMGGAGGRWGPMPTPTARMTPEQFGAAVTARVKAPSAVAPGATSQPASQPMITGGFGGGFRAVPAPSAPLPSAPTTSLSEPAPAPPSNWDRMRNMEPGYNPLTMLTGNTPDRLAMYADLNQQRRAWDASGGVMGEIDPAVEAATLRARLEGIADKTSVPAQTIANRLRQLEQSLAQKMTRSGRLIDPVSTASETVPRQAVGRLMGPDF